MAVRVWNRDQGAEMQDDLATFDRAVHRFGVREVAAEDVDFLRDLRLGQLEQSVIPARVVANERPDGCAGVNERLREVAADEAAGSGDEYTPTRPCLRRVAHRQRNLL